jgi:nitrite reductase (NADH) small subunit
MPARTVCPAAELGPGKLRVIEIDSQPVVVRNAGGTLYAIENICPHRGGPIAEGEIRGGAITCPWHDWSFDLASGQNTMNPAATIRMFPCRIEGGNVIVDA